jgi:hypothetical protein
MSELEPNRSPSTDRTKKRAQKRGRRLKLSAQRRAAINNPDSARVRPVGLSPSDFALATGLSAATIGRAIRDGRLRSIKLMGCRLIAYDELERVRRGE